MIYRMLGRLDDVAHGSKVSRSEGQALAHPSICSREFSQVLRKMILSHSWDHPPLDAGCYLNSVFREMKIISSTVKRMDLRSKPE